MRWLPSAPTQVSVQPAQCLGKIVVMGGTGGIAAGLAGLGHVGVPDDGGASKISRSDEDRAAPPCALCRDG